MSGFGDQIASMLSFHDLLAQLKALLAAGERPSVAPGLQFDQPPPPPANALAGVQQQGPPPAMSSIPDMVANNPRGWGNAPPAPQNILQKEPDNFRGEARGQGPGESRYPYAPMENSVEGQLAETTPPVFPGEGAIVSGVGNALRFAARPTVAGPIALGASMLGDMSSASTAGDSPVPRLNDQRAILVQQQADALRRKQENQDSPGPKFRQAQKDYEDASGQISSIDHQLDAYANSPEHQQDIAKRADDLAAAAKAKEAATPFRERYPGVAGVLPWAGVGLSAALPFALRGKANLGSFLPESAAGRARTAISGAEDAIRSGNQNAMAVSRTELGGILDDQPGILKKAGKAGAAALSGGAFAAESNMLPDQVDAFNLPEGAAKEHAWSRITDPSAYRDRALIGAATGLSGYKAGDLIPSRSPNVPRMNALREFLDTGPQSAPAASERVIVRSSSGTYHDANTGQFVTPPKRKP